MRFSKRLVADAHWLTAWFLFYEFTKSFKYILPETELKEAEEIRERIRRIAAKAEKRRPNQEIQLKNIICASMIQGSGVRVMRKTYNQWLKKLKMPWRVRV